MDIFATSTLPQLEKALNRDTLKQSVIAQNIANVDTPGYKAKQVSFGNVLQGELQAKKTEKSHISFSSDNGTHVVENHSALMQNNGNSVDIDKEMANLAKTQIHNQAVVAAVNHQLQQYKQVIGGGR